MKPHKYPCSLGTFMVAGLAYSDFQKLSRKHKIEGTLKPGALVTALPEPDNPTDALAIKLFIGDVHIGYVPKQSAIYQQMWKIRRAGKRCELRVKSYFPQNPTWHMLAVEVKHERLIEIETEQEPF